MAGTKTCHFVSLILILRAVLSLFKNISYLKADFDLSQG